MLVVQKYGGSSVADAERMQRVAKRICSVNDEGHGIIAVVSAMGDTTDDLIELMGKITQTPDIREMDVFL
ncbi:MAG: aspartate kinase, partial [Peptococcaceae bacterium]|nr:aspartate kinase [Peptococcaceae bacterium]